jgi:hypothetical protein
LREEELTLTISGCMLRSTGRISFLHWKDVQAVLQNDSLILFKLGINVFHVIPKSAFRSRAEVEEFFQRCQEYWSVSRAGPEDPNVVTAIVIETGNPYQSPRQT